MSVKSGQAVTVLFSTANATTGAATDATGTPTGALYVNGTANGATVTVTNITTGVYKCAVTLPSLSAGDVVSLRVAATVSAVAGEGIIWQDVADTKRISDLADASNATLESRLTADRAGYLDNLSGGAAALESTAQAILDDTAEIGAAGAGLTALATQASVNDVPTNAELATALGTADDAVIAAIAALNNLSSAGAQSAAAAALTAYGAATAAQVAAISPPSAATIADAVWDEATAGHATAGSTGAALAAAGSAGDPWSTTLPGAYGAGTAGAIVGGWDDAVFASASVAAAVNGSDLSIHRGDTFSASIAGLGNIGARTQLYWTVKESPNIADASATVHVEEDAGLVYLNGAAGTAGQGDITVTDATDGDITITLAAAATAQLTPGVYVYDVQMVTATGVETLTAANLTVVADVTRAVV